jgi:hypothetical protein
MKSKDQQLLEEAYASMGLKHVFVVMQEIDYEGDRVYGIYTSQQLANAAAEKHGGGAEVKMVSVNGAPSLDFLHNN